MNNRIHYKWGDVIRNKSIFILILLFLIITGCGGNEGEELIEEFEVPQSEDSSKINEITTDNAFPKLGSTINPDVINFIGEETWSHANVEFVEYGLKLLKVTSFPYDNNMVGIFTLVDNPNDLNWIEWFTPSSLSTDEQMSLPFQVMPDDATHNTSFVSNCTGNELEICEVFSFYNSSIGDISINITPKINKVRVTLHPVGWHDRTISTFFEHENKFLMSDYSIEALDEVKSKLAKNLEINENTPINNIRIENGMATYYDDQYGFAFDYPAEWVNHIEFKTNIRQGAETTIDMIYINGSLSEYMLSVVIYDEEIPEQEWENSWERYLAINNGKTFTIGLATEPSEKLLQPDNQDVLEHMQKIWLDSDIIERTFRFE